MYAVVMSLTSVNFYKKLDLEQREAADIFGGGVNAFSRYENGKTKPPLALVKLLKVLESHQPPKKQMPAQRGRIAHQQQQLAPCAGHAHVHAAAGVRREANLG
jgi:hypothetical protein